MTLCNDSTIDMLILLSAEPSHINAFETIATLSFSQTERPS